jgi:hypothetical protein
LWKERIMPTYGMLIVNTSWSNENTVQIDKTAFLRYKGLLGADTLALIYMREPIDAVVAEAEITSDVIETEAELLEQVTDVPADRDAQIASQNVTSTPNRGVANEYHVPLKVLRPKGSQTTPLPLASLKTILGSDFSVYDETWIPLSDDQYNQIIALWGT